MLRVSPRILKKIKMMVTPFVRAPDYQNLRGATVLGKDE